MRERLKEILKRNPLAEHVLVSGKKHNKLWMDVWDVIYQSSKETTGRKKR